jgi:hypothetical protein
MKISTKFLSLLRSILRINKVSEKFAEKIKTHFLYSITSFEYCALFEIKSKNSVGSVRPQMTIWRMRTVYWIIKATKTHPEHAIFLLFHGINGYDKAPHCYVLCSVSALW